MTNQSAKAIETIDDRAWIPPFSQVYKNDLEANIARLVEFRRPWAEAQAVLQAIHEDDMPDFNAEDFAGLRRRTGTLLREG